MVRQKKPGTMTMSKTIMVVALAATLMLASLATKADETKTSFNVAPGACTNPIAIPANNTPVLMMGNSITYDDRESALVTITRAYKFQPYPVLTWAGTDFFIGTEKGFAFDPGIIIMYLDTPGYIYVQSAASTHVQVCNSSKDTKNGIGYLTFIY